MIGLSLQTSIIKTEVSEVVYNLIFKNAFYSIECFKKGSSKRDAVNYCYMENITDDEGEAEDFLNLLAKRKVFPVHIKDIAEDYFH